MLWGHVPLQWQRVRSNRNQELGAPIMPPNEQALPLSHGPTETSTSHSGLFQEREVNLRLFLPPPTHPRYLSILADLISRDMSRRWRAGHARPLPAYRPEFPEVFANAAMLGRIARVEYDLRQLAGERVSPREYEALGICTADWPQPPATTNFVPADQLEPLIHQELVSNAGMHAGDSLHVKEPNSAEGWPRSHSVGSQLRAASAGTEMKKPARVWPEPGAELLGFQLLQLLGRGAFARVYLAQQVDLANRHVVLKITREKLPEPKVLAQLRHTNIVPIHAHYQSGEYSVVCMPFLGATTLAHLLDHIQKRSALPKSGSEILETMRHCRAEAFSSADFPTTPASWPGGIVAVAEPVPATAMPLSPAWKVLEQYSYIDAVLWIMARVAAGLAHAHARGILHRDLKPGNILLSDDGEPLLLDFSIAEDTKQRNRDTGQLLGGTLPYLAPEHLLAFQEKRVLLDERGDIYALGIILFELLSGRLPHPLREGLREVVILGMIEDRKRPAPSIREANHDVSSAVAAVIRRCLAIDTNERYQKVADLQEDLERQLESRPLKYAHEPWGRERLAKWLRRHPRSTSTSGVAVFAAALLCLAAGGFVLERDHRQELHARENLREHREDFRRLQAFLDDRHHAYAQLDNGEALCRDALARYGIDPNQLASDWQQQSAVRRLHANEKALLRADIGEILYLLAKVTIRRVESSDLLPAQQTEMLLKSLRWNELAEQYGNDRLPRAVLEQRAELLRLAGDRREADRIRDLARSVPLETARDYYLVAYDLVQHGRYRDALPLLQVATRLEPDYFSAWFVRGNTHLALEQPEMAVASFTSCIALRQDFAPAWLNRGICYHRLRFFEQALDDFDRAVQLQPDLAEGWLQKAAAHQGLGQWAASVEDLTHALECGSHSTRVYFLRARAREKTGNKDGAQSDRGEGLRLTPNDELSWVARAEMRLPADPQAALADVESALKLNPRSSFALQLQAHILGEHLNRPADAVRVLNQAVEWYPDQVPVRAGRGVLLARQGKREEALSDAREALLRDTKPPNLYQVACIYALTSKQAAEDRVPAYRLLRSALRAGFGLDLLPNDSDFDPLRDQPEFRQLQESAKAWRQGMK